MVHTFYGTPLYLSPEVLERRAYNEKTDLWSLGVVLYELAALQPPFQASSLVALSQVVLRGEYEPLPSRYSRTMTRCVRWLLTKDFRARPHINQVLDFLAEKVGKSSSLSGSLSMFDCDCGSGGAAGYLNSCGASCSTCCLTSRAGAGEGRRRLCGRRFSRWRSRQLKAPASRREEFTQRVGEARREEKRTVPESSSFTSSCSHSPSAS